MRRYLQAMTHPAWAWDVGLNGRPHDLGNISAYLGNRLVLKTISAGLHLISILLFRGAIWSGYVISGMGR